jgi:hypothetical protein
MLISKNHITYHVKVSFTDSISHPIKAKISTEGDNYKINKISKFGKKIHEQLSTETFPYPTTQQISKLITLTT